MFCAFSDVLLAFTCAGAIGSLWHIWLGLNIFISTPYFALCLHSDATKEYLLNSLITACLDF